MKWLRISCAILCIIAGITFLIIADSLRAPLMIGVTCIEIGYSLATIGYETIFTPGRLL